MVVGAEHAELGVTRLHASLQLLQAPLVDRAKCLDLHEGMARLKRGKVLVREEDERHPLDLRMPFELMARSPEGDLGGSLDRVAVHTGRDRGERDGAAAELSSDLEGAPVARGKELGLVLIAAVPDWADGVDDVLRRKLAGGRRFRIAGLAAAKREGLLEDRGAAGAMDRPVHAAPAAER